MENITIKTYEPSELKTTVLNSDNSESEAEVRIRLGFREKDVSLNLLLLSNGKMYLTNNSLLGVKYNEELNPTKILNAIQLLNITSSSLEYKVRLINDANISPRQIKGYIHNVVEDYDSKLSELKDLDKVFVKSKGEFAYYSATTNELIPLPKGAHRFLLVRSLDTIKNTNIPMYILEDCKVRCINNDQVEELVPTDEEYGSEYVIQYEIGTIIYTPVGYIHLEGTKYITNNY